MPRPFLACLVLLAATRALEAQAPAAKEPIPRLEAGGPTSFVTAVALSPDGGTLYAAGYDQVVRVWTRTAQGEWALDKFAFRVPIGPGIRGAVNALAVSADGRWLAAGGQGPVDAGFREAGFVVPTVGLPKERFRDIGVIHVWDTQTRAATVLRGHTGSVVALAFGPARAGKPPLLASAAQEIDFDNNYKDIGGVRLWDVAAAKPELGARTLPELPDARAGLSVWGEPERPLVAIGWGDGKLRRWDVAGNTIDAWDDGPLNQPLASFFDRPKFLTTSYDGAGGLRVWAQTGMEAPAALPLAAAGQIPRAVALISSLANGAADHLAVVLETETPGRERIRPFALQIVRLSDAQTVRTVPLWQGRKNWPTLAAAPNGQHLVVAGNDRHEIHVYSIEQLLKGGGEPKVLRSVGATFRQAAFLKKGDALGLSLSETAKVEPGQPPREARAGDLVFDLTGRKLGGNPAGWLPASAQPGDWRVRIASENSRWSVVVLHGTDEKTTIALRRGQRVTDVALLPPGKWHAHPIVAIASEARLQPFLALYDGVSGDQFRLCTGHTDPILGLAFSADGRMLASAAEDQTVCVWSLTNLDRVLGTRGLLRGLPVQEAAGRLRLAKPDDERILSANAATLKEKGVSEGDELEGVVEPTGVRRLAKTAAFYDAVSRIEPGKPVTLRFANRGDVVLTVGQAIDERKPLFTLFATRDGRAEERDWVGWSPFGPYEYSDRKAERWLGWHFNPSRAEAAATFDSPAEQYHKEFFREGILRQLLAQGAIAPALREWDKDELRKPLPRPVLKPWIDGVKPDADRVVLRQPPAKLNLLIGNFPPERIAALTWQIGDGAKQPFDAGAGVERSADLSKAEWKRGPATIRVALTTLAEEPQTFVEELPIRYQAPAPELPDVPANEKRRVVDQARFAWGLTFKPAGRQLRIAFRQFHDDKEVLSATEAREYSVKGEPTEIKPTFTLKPGLNRLQIAAVNADAGPADAEFETTTLAILVEYQPKPVPRLSLDAVIPLLDKERAPGESIAVPATQAVAVARPIVRLKGTVAADEELSDLRWSIGAAEGRTMSGFGTGKKEFAFQQLVALKPGPNVVRVSAKAKSGGEAGQRVTIDYRPELPRAEIAQPGRGQQFFDAGPIEVRARVFPADDPTPFRIVLLVNGREAGAAQTPQGDAEELVFQAPLAAGNNRLELRLNNEWGAERLSEAAPVRLVRPPAVRGEDAPAESAKPLVALTAVIRSALPVGLNSVEVRVNDRPAPVRVELVGAHDEFKVRLIDVPLVAGKNVVKMWVRNDDARARLPAEWTIAYTPPAQAPSAPEIEFVEPAGDVRVTDSRLNVRLRVRSAGPLARVELRREGGNPLRHNFNLAGVSPNAQGVYDLKAEIDLIPGPNALRAFAVSAGGQREAAVVASFLQEPVELIVEKLTARGAEGAPLLPKLDANGRLTFDRPADDARAFLHGLVYWAREDDEQFRTASEVRVFVNGFQQKPGELLPFRGVKSRNRPERRFVVEIELNRAKDNHIEVVLPGLKQRSANRREFAVDCARPEVIRRLHVFPVVVRAKGAAAVDGAQIAAKLRELVPGAAQAQVLVHGPLTKFVSQNEVMGELVKMKRFLDGAASDGATGDLAVIYYQGGESIEPGGHYLLTSASAFNPDPASSAVSCASLAELFDRSLGASLLLFDVTRSGGSDADRLHDAIAQWPDQPNVGVFRWSRRSPAGPRMLADLSAEFRAATELSDVPADLGKKFTWKSDEWAWSVPGEPGTLAIWRIPVNLGGLRIK